MCSPLKNETTGRKDKEEAIELFQLLKGNILTLKLHENILFKIN